MILLGFMNVEDAVLLGRNNMKELFEGDLKEVGRIKNLVSYWDDKNKILYIERQETKGVLTPIYKNEQKHLERVLIRIDQRFKTWRKNAKRT